MTLATALRQLRAVDVMSAPAITVGPEVTPWDAWHLMVDEGIRHLIVSINGHCVGVLDDREIFGQWPMGPLALRRARIGTMMRHRVSRVLPDTELREVARVMACDGVDVVPVVDDHGRPIGVVTAADITAAVARFGITDETVDGCG